ncbi:MAG: Ppx/GppA family phosphatase [Nitrospirae bacterium]|nr:Ppx/GppA family phosphatase [Nitrospirota bacterium]
MRSRTLAGIDIGTNTFRLLIAKVDDKGLNELYSARVITRLGEGVSLTGLLKEEAIERGLNALKEFRNIIAAHKVEAVAAVATSAFRVAKNSGDFIKRAKDETGIDPKIISEEEEEWKTFRGMKTGIKVPESSLMVDIGGGSTEFILSKNGEATLMRSLKLGVVYLADMYMKSDPPADDEKMLMRHAVLQSLSSLEPQFSEAKALIGTAGTITTISAMAKGLTIFERSKIHNTRISLEPVREIYTAISGSARKERAELYPVLDSSRLDIIVPGAMILLEIMIKFGFKEITVSDNGLMEGILLDLYDKIT